MVRRCALAHGHAKVSPVHTQQCWVSLNHLMVKRARHCWEEECKQEEDARSGVGWEESALSGLSGGDYRDSRDFNIKSYLYSYKKDLDYPLNNSQKV